MPQFVIKDGKHALMVDGAPFLILGAQVNNYSNYPGIMEKVWPAMQVLGLGLLLGVGMGVLSAGMAHAAQRGRRDFASAQAIVASRYEILGEHTVVNRARQMLGQAPLQPQQPTAWPPTPHQADQGQEPR